MATKKSNRAAGRKPISLKTVRRPPRKGLVMAQEARFPATVDDKLICAKSVVQAVLAAHDSGALDDHNYDLHWPLNLAVELLEQAFAQLGNAKLQEVRL
jgi:hypothetical protein